MKQVEWTKQQRMDIFLLFVEFVVMPMLALSFAILIAAVASYELSPSKFELLAIICTAVAIPFLAISVFMRKMISTINPKLISKKEPEKVQWAEAIGVATGAIGFLCYVASANVWIAVLFVISLCIAFYMHINYLRQSRDQ